MPEGNESADSFAEFFSASKPENDHDEKQSKPNDTPTKSTIPALIKSQPVLHRRTPLETKGKNFIFQSFIFSFMFNFILKATTNSKKMPLTTNIENTPVKSKRIESPPPTTYESGSK